MRAVSAWNGTYYSYPVGVISRLNGIKPCEA